MKNNTFKQYGIQVITTPEELSSFAQQVTEKTAKKIIKEIHAPDKPISEKEVCIKLKKTRQTLSRYRKEGKIRYHRIGREIYYFPSEFEEDIKKF